MVRKVLLPSHVELGRKIPSQLTVCRVFPSQQLKQALISQKRMLVPYSFSVGLILLLHMRKCRNNSNDNISKLRQQMVSVMVLLGC